MKTITCSNRIYYSELSSEEANALHQDIQLYHAMMHTAYHLLWLKSQGIPFPFENSLEKEPVKPSVVRPCAHAALAISCKVFLPSHIVEWQWTLDFL